MATVLFLYYRFVRLTAAFVFYTANGGILSGSLIKLGSSVSITTVHLFELGLRQIQFANKIPKENICPLEEPKDQ
jgi:hypothetical protein